MEHTASAQSKLRGAVFLVRFPYATIADSADVFLMLPLPLLSLRTLATI
jgi:hypothetical protein